MLLVLFGAGAAWVRAQGSLQRIPPEINATESAQIEGSHHPLAQPQYDAGRMPASMRLTGISLYFNRSAAQESDLQSLLISQQNPASSQYHRWLTPDQFAIRFGMSSGDIRSVETWLQQQGFSIDSVNRSRNAIRFSGTVGQVEQAFQAQMHYYAINGVKHFAPSTPLSVPSAIAPVVMSVRNLDDFRPKPMHTRPRAGFTSGMSGNVFFAPGDILTAYDFLPLTGGGDNGSGQTIGIMGQSQVALSDIENFESATGLPIKDPNVVIVPGSGNSAISSGDESESDLDLEWSGAIAQGASIVFVYTGDNINYSAFDSLAYAIDEDLANILSLSYGVCEPEATQSEVNSMESQLAQAAAQGQTVLAASGDQGSTACYVSPTTTNPPVSTQEELAVNYPASSAYVLGVGGTEISSNDVFGGSDFSTYWTSNGSNDVVSSLKQYIPEIAWNDDDATYGISASGGGASIYVARPPWQKGVSGIASGSFRLVPDVSLYSSPDLPGYLFCSSDTSAWSTGGVGTPAQQASCNSGFRDASTGDLTVAGGTSFATPIFAGIVAILNQKLSYTTGQGLVNPTFYTLAANSSTYASAFHDVTSGNNDCLAGSTYCNGSNGFSAGTGYDEVTGLGSVDVANLAAAWPANTGSSASLIGTATTVSASNTAPAVGASVTFTITVTADSGASTPSGTVNLSIDGAGTAYGATGSSAVPLTLSTNGTVTYTTSFTVAGPHEIVAQYAGAGSFGSSVGSSLITIPVTSSGKGTFALAASPSSLTVAQGSSGTETIAATPSNGYTGTVSLSVDFGSADTALQNLCGGFGSGESSLGTIAVSGAGAASTTLTLDANASDCATAAAVARTGLRPLKTIMKKTKTAKNDPKPFPGPVPTGIVLAGLAVIGYLGRRSRYLRNLVAVLMLTVAGFALSACGSTSGSATVSNPPKGTYTATITGQDSVTSTITSTTSFTFVID